MSKNLKRETLIKMFDFNHAEIDKYFVLMEKTPMLCFVLDALFRRDVWPIRYRYVTERQQQNELIIALLRDQTDLEVQNE